MDDSSKSQSDQPESSAAGAISQDDIDALLAGAESAAESPAEPEAPPPAGSEGGQFSQADIDALMSGGADPGTGDQAAETPAEEPPPDSRVDSLGRPFDESAAAMQAAIDADKAQPAATAPPADAASSGPAPESRQVPLPEFGDDKALEDHAKRVTMLSDVNLRVKLQLGQTRMLVEDVLKLGEGSVVELDKLAGDPVDVLINERLVARGEILILNDTFCVRISEVLSNDPHRVTT